LHSIQPIVTTAPSRDTKKRERERIPHETTQRTWCGMAHISLQFLYILAPLFCARALLVINAVVFSCLFFSSLVRTLGRHYFLNTLYLYAEPCRPAMFLRSPVLIPLVIPTGPTRPPFRASVFCFICGADVSFSVHSPFAPATSAGESGYRWYNKFAMHRSTMLCALSPGLCCCAWCWFATPPPTPGPAPRAPRIRALDASRNRLSLMLCEVAASSLPMIARSSSKPPVSFRGGSPNGLCARSCTPAGAPGPGWFAYPYGGNIIIPLLLLFGACWLPAAPC